MKIGDTVKDSKGNTFKLSGDGFMEDRWFLYGEDSLESKSISFVKSNYTLVHSCDDSPIVFTCMFS